MVGKSIVTHKRAVQGALSFDKETNPKRLQNFYYSFRNWGYVSTKSSVIKKIKYYIKHLILAFKYFIKGQPLKSCIIIKSLYSHLTFSPIVIFPNKNQQ